MRLSDRYDGSGDPFEGDRTIVWRSLPANAMVTKATVGLAPVAPPGLGGYLETLNFGAAGPTFGAVIAQAGTGVVELDFHAKRTANSISGLENVTPATLSVDVGGGVFMAVGADGTLPAQTGSNFPFGSGSLPGISAQRMRLIAATLPSDLGAVSVDIATMPSNVTLRFGKRLPFWAKNGELAVAVTTPDVTEALQRALADAAVANGFYIIPLVVHSDTLGRLSLTVDVEYLCSAPLVAAGLREVVLPYDYSGVPAAPATALQAQLPAGAAVVSPQTALQVRGAFDASRVAYGPTGVTNEATTVRCSASETLAQPLLPSNDTNISGMDVFVVAEGPAARLVVDLRTDFDGKPSTTSLLAKPVPIDLTGDASGQRRWVNVGMTPAALLKGGARTWLVVQTTDGAAQIGIDATPDAARLLQRSTDAGFSWRQAGLSSPLLLRLRTVPERFHMPIDFTAGTGPQPQRVSLAAYDALGKVDAVIDRPEIAAAVQAAATQALPPPCAIAEVLQNSDFSQWSAQGTTLSEDTPVTPGANETIALIETFFDRQVATLRAGRPQALSWSADGSTLFASFDESIFRFDPVTLNATSLVHGLSALAFAVDPSGGALYAVDGNALIAIDLPSATTRTVLETGDAQLVTLSPDGRRAYVGGATAVVGFDLMAGNELFRISVPATFPTVALTADGATLVTADQTAGQVLTFDAATGAPGWSGPLPQSLNPLAVAVAADGVSVYALGVQTSSENFVDGGEGAPTPGLLVAFDARGRIQQQLTVSSVDAAGVTSLLVKPQGDRLYLSAAAAALDPAGGRIASGGGSTIGIIAVGQRTPVGWTLTAGQVAPQQSPDDVHATAALLDEGSLSQVQAVAPACLHDLTVAAAVGSRGKLKQSPDAVAEVFWLDAAGALLRTDSKPLPSSMLVSTQRLRLTPPAGSAQVEVRARVAGGTVLLKTISLKTTYALLQDDAWQPDPAAASLVVTTLDATGTTYRNFGAGTAALAQSLTPQGSPLRLDFKGAVVAGSPTIEFSYQDANGAPTGPVQSIALGGGWSFASQPAQLGLPPAGASTRVRIVLPAGSALRVERLTLESTPMAIVPCSFIAQSPGTLHVANAQVAYDLKSGAAPQPPQGGLAKPTPPGGTPGDPTCACDPTMTSAVGPGAVLPKPFAVRTFAATPPAAAIPDPLLTDIEGIGAGRARRLSAAKIASVRDLAAATPQSVATALAGPAVTDELAGALIERAKAALSARTPDARG